ncbi:MAG: barstar family protein [Dechloromonas sp.]|jgi:RNAse (barnase) inhibitor barstar|nr:barstar family protein [Dechloromonas sp.]
MAQVTHGLFFLPGEAALASAVAVDLDKSGKTGKLLQRIGQTLAFPAWYGANFDALFDCLSEADTPTRVRLHGLAAYAGQQPDDFAILTEVLRAACDARAEAGKPLLICIDVEADDIPPWPGE